MTQVVTGARPAEASTQIRDRHGDRERALAYAAKNVDRYEQELAAAGSSTECQRAHRCILHLQVLDWQRVVDRLLLHH